MRLEPAGQAEALHIEGEYRRDVPRRQAESKAEVLRTGRHQLSCHLDMGPPSFRRAVQRHAIEPDGSSAQRDGAPGVRLLQACSHLPVGDQSAPREIYADALARDLDLPLRLASALRLHRGNDLSASSGDPELPTATHELVEQGEIGGLCLRLTRYPEGLGEASELERWALGEDLKADAAHQHGPRPLHLDGVGGDREIRLESAALLFG